MNAKASSATAAQAQMSKILKAMNSCVSKDSTQYNLARVNVQGAVLTATDGYLLLEVTLDEQPGLESGCYTPKSAAALLAAGVTPSPEEDGIRFPDYKQVIPRNEEHLPGAPAFVASILVRLLDAMDEVGRALAKGVVPVQPIMGDTYGPTRFKAKVPGATIVGVIMPYRL